MQKTSPLSNIAVGLQNMQQYKRLEDYLRLNGGMEMYSVQMRGACMFASLRRCIDCPLEYQHTLKKTACPSRKPQIFWPVLSGNYGHLRLDTATYDRKKQDSYPTGEGGQPGPFSLISYLKVDEENT